MGNIIDKQHDKQIYKAMVRKLERVRVPLAYMKFLILDDYKLPRDYIEKCFYEAHESVMQTGQQIRLYREGIVVVIEKEKIDEFYDNYVEEMSKYPNVCIKSKKHISKGIHVSSLYKQEKLIKHGMEFMASLD